MEIDIDKCHLQMSSKLKDGGFSKWGYPQASYFRIFHCKPSSHLGYPHDDGNLHLTGESLVQHKIPLLKPTTGSNCRVQSWTLTLAQKMVAG